ncbi:MAG: hypothetical protein RL111_304 [Pseudomonadota bacterium]|jgi:hypothetical protein
MNEVVSPTLDLHEAVGPALTLEPSDLGRMMLASGTPMALGMFCTLAVLSMAVLVPISKMATGNPEHTWARIFGEVMQGVGDAADNIELPVAAQAPEAPDAAGSDPFAVATLSPLKGTYCMDYMPGGTNPRAVQAFGQLVWNKLNKELQEIADERLEVCTPFERVNDEVVSAGGCAKSQCGTNDVNFYLNQQGLTAVDYRVNGECRYAAEDGFTQIQLMCR